MNFRTFVAFGGCMLALSACAAQNINEGQYWQRVNSSEQVYQQGPKVQQMLDRDIGRCVTELKELESLGTVKDPIKTDIQGRVRDPDEIKEDEHIPGPNGMVIPDDRTFKDFDGCMLSKGWMRVMHMPHEVKPPQYSDFSGESKKNDQDSKLGSNN